MPSSTPEAPAEPDWDFLQRKKLQLCPSHMRRIGKLSEIYLASSAEALDLGQDGALDCLRALWEISKEQGSGMKKAHAKAIGMMVLSADTTALIPVSRQPAPKTQLATFAAAPGKMSVASAKLLQNGELPAESVLVKPILGPKRIASEAAYFGFDGQTARDLTEKYADFLETSVSTLLDMGFGAPKDYHELLGIWKQVSSILWSNFSQADRFDNYSHSIAFSVMRNVLNCATSTFVISDILRQFNVESTKLTLVHSTPQSGHAILHAVLPESGISAYIETRAQYPDYYNRGLEFGTYRDIGDVLKEYPLIFAELKFENIVEYGGLRHSLDSDIISKRKKILADIECEPADAKNYLLYGQILHMLGDNTAEVYFKKAMQFDPHLIDAHLALAEFQLKTNYYGDYRGNDRTNDQMRAIMVIENGIRQNPRSDRLYERMGDMHYISEKSVAAYTRAMEIKPSANLYLKRARQYEWHASEHKSTQSYRLAIFDLLRAIEMEPRLVGAYQSLSQAYISLEYDRPNSYKQKDEYLRPIINAVWKAAIKKNIHDPRFYVAYAEYYAKVSKGRKDLVEKSIWAYTKALELQLEPSILLERAGAYVMAGEFGRARDDYRKAIEISPNNIGAYRSLKNMYDEMGIIWQYTKGRKPNGVKEIAEELGKLQKGFGDAASDVMKEGLEKNQYDYRFNDAMGRLFADKMHSYVRAIPYFEKALELILRQKKGSDNWGDYSVLHNIHTGLASAYMGNSQAAKAKEQLELAEEAWKKKESLRKATGN